MRKTGKASRNAGTYKIVQVPIDPELLGLIDVAADRAAESRAAYIRGACRRRLTREEMAALDQRYVEGYQRKPEREAWGKLGARLLARRLRGERW